MTEQIFIQEEQTLKFLKQMSKARNDSDEIDHLSSVEYMYDLYDSEELSYLEAHDLYDSDEPGYLGAIVLNFERKSFTVKAVSEDSTIEIVPGKFKPNSEQKLMSVSEEEPWCKVIGDFIGWSWALINNQGYPDAIQFEFIEDEYHKSTTAIIQLVTMSSSIDVYELDKIER